jgi:Holliday junction resolvase-like predicted endonuclease
MTLKITKSSGRSEEFNIQKLSDSLIRSGAPPEVAYEIAKEIEKQLTPSMKTREIFRRARKLLRRYNHVSGMRYSIKRAIFALGPSGYPFEKYVGRIFERYGYAVETNRIVQGHCVSHEVDVIASAGKSFSVIECKYHSDAGKATDVKVALYVHSRVQDIRKAAESEQAEHKTFQDGWLVTNTRCTIDAIRYAECVGLRIVSWRYPGRNSLERMIEDKRLYPVTILNSIRRNMLTPLFNADIILALDVADMDEALFAQKTGFDELTVRALKKEADAIC